MTSDEKPLKTVIDRVVDHDVMLLRQASPASMVDGQLTSAVFKTSAEHGFVLSTDHGRLTARIAYERYLASDRASAGTWQFSVKEAEGCGLVPWEDGGTLDPEMDRVPEHHVAVPMTHLSSKGIERAARSLKKFALQHGCQHPVQ